MIGAYFFYDMNYGLKHGDYKEYSFDYPYDWKNSSYMSEGIQIMKNVEGTVYYINIHSIDNGTNFKNYVNDYVEEYKNEKSDNSTPKYIVSNIKSINVNGLDGYEFSVVSNDSSSDGHIRHVGGASFYQTDSHVEHKFIFLSNNGKITTIEFVGEYLDKIKSDTDIFLNSFKID
jgi:hypothetical protein